MSIDTDKLYNNILAAAEGAFKDGWQAVKAYAPAEFKKMAIQLAEIAENIALYQADETQGYSPQTGKILFNMQKASCESVLVAITQLTLDTVQKAMKSIIAVLKNAVGTIISGVL
jgi:hypothetical protein